MWLALLFFPEESAMRDHSLGLGNILLLIIIGIILGLLIIFIASRVFQKTGRKSKYPVGI